MPICLEPLDDGGVLLKGSGRLVFADIQQANATIYESPQKIRELRYQLADYSEVTEVVLSATEVMRLAKEDAAAAIHNPGMVIAVVGRGDLLYGLLRMWEAYAAAATFPTCVFRNVAEAKTWIAERLSTHR